MSTTLRKIEFPEVGGKKSPWYALYDGTVNGIRTYDLFSGDDSYAGYIDEDGHLTVVINHDIFKRLNKSIPKKTDRTFNQNSRKGLLEAVRYTYLIIEQETIEGRPERLESARSQKIQDAILKRTMNNVIRIRIRRAKK